MRKYTQYLIEQLEALHEENPKTYCALLDQLNNENKQFKESNINVDDWLKYFKILNTDIVQNQHKLIAEKLKTLENFKTKLMNKNYKIKILK